jgi:hypothetical protein
MTMITVNEITRIIVALLALAIAIKYARLLIRHRPVPFLAAIFPLVFAAQVVAFFVLQRAGGVDPLLLNWFSQLIRVQVLIYFLVI